MDDLTKGDVLEGRFFCESCFKFLDEWIFVGWVVEESDGYRPRPTGYKIMITNCPRCDKPKSLIRQRKAPERLALSSRGGS